MQNFDNQFIQSDKSFSEDKNISDPEAAFWDEFYKNRKQPFEIREFEDGTRFKIEIPFPKIKTN